MQAENWLQAHKPKIMELIHKWRQIWLPESVWKNMPPGLLCAPSLLKSFINELEEPVNRMLVNPARNAKLASVREKRRPSSDAEGWAEWLDACRGGGRHSGMCLWRLCVGWFEKVRLRNDGDVTAEGQRRGRENKVRVTW